MPNTILNGIDLYYEVHGADAPSNGSAPLMLIAGLASDSQSWLPVLTPLAEARTVILFDNRGCGRTSPQDTVSSIHQMAEDCIALADHLDIDRFDLLGHSMGGLIAIDCASHHPGRIRRLALVNCAAANTRRNQLLFDDWGDALRLAQSPERWFRNFFYWMFPPPPAVLRRPGTSEQVLEARRRISLSADDGRLSCSGRGDAWLRPR